MLNCAIIIPALDPPQALIDYVKTLLSRGFARVIVINDGSSEEKASIFNELSTLDGCTVLTHSMNRGKGRALKTAFEYVLQLDQDLVGVVTADADGQHEVEDVCKVASALVCYRDGIILGVRDFSQSNVPWRSLIGNRLTSILIQLFFGHKIEDTQTGLRGIPKKELAWMLELKGERFEYEMNMLINVIRRRIKVREVSIQTLYFNRNAGSHYHSIIDSLRIFVRIISGFLRSFLQVKNTSPKTNGRKK